MEYTQVSATAFQELQMNAGVVVDDFTPNTGVIGNILGVTSGGITFNSNPTYVDFGDGMDNVPGNTWQLKRVTSYDPVLSGTFLTMTATLAKQLSGAGGESSGHITPSNALTETDFDDIWLVGDYSDKNDNGTNKTAGFCAVHIMNALNTSGFQWKSNDDGKGEYSFEFHGHYDIENIDTVPFEIYVKAGTASS
jgi:hypothetical protein